MRTITTVSYTHLDVYKRQVTTRANPSLNGHLSKWSHFTETQGWLLKTGFTVLTVLGLEETMLKK